MKYNSCEADLVVKMQIAEQEKGVQVTLERSENSHVHIPSAEK